MFWSTVINLRVHAPRYKLPIVFIVVLYDRRIVFGSSLKGDVIKRAFIFGGFFAPYTSHHTCIEKPKMKNSKCLSLYSLKKKVQFNKSAHWIVSSVEPARQSVRYNVHWNPPVYGEGVFHSLKRLLSCSTYSTVKGGRMNAWCKVFRAICLRQAEKQQQRSRQIHHAKRYITTPHSTALVPSPPRPPGYLRAPSTTRDINKRANITNTT